MTRSISPPFLTAPPDALGIDWTMLLDGARVPLPELLKDWDYATPLSIAATWNGPSDRFMAECGMAASDTLGCLITWHSTGTNLRGASAAEPWPACKQVALELGGDRLGGILNLEMQIVLLQPGVGDRANRLTATRPASVLWRTRFAVALEGEGPRFPTEAADFGLTGLAPAQAAWRLTWDPTDLFAAAMGSVRLYVNSSLPLMRRLIADPGASPDVRVAFGAMRHELVRSLLAGLLSNEDFQDGADFGAGSVGESGLAIIGALFPQETATTLRSTLQEDPQVFETKVQHAVRLWADET